MFRRLFEHSPDAIWVLDPVSGTFVDGNASAVEMTGAGTRERLLGMSPRDLVPLGAEMESQENGDTSPVRHILRAEAGGPARLEWSLRRFDGTWLPVEVVITRVADVEPSMVVVMARDDSKRRRVDAELRASEERFRRMFEDSADAMALIDPATGRFMDVNQALLVKLGYERKEQLVGTPVSGAAPGTQPDGLSSSEGASMAIRRALREGSIRTEWVASRFDGSMMPVDTVLTAMQFGGRRLLLSVSRDISERKRAEASLKKLNASLEELVAERTSALQVSNQLLRDEVVERQRREKVEHALFRIAEAIHQARDMESLYPLLHDAVGELMPAANFFIALYDPATELHHFVYHRDEMDPPPPPRRLGAGLTAHVFRTGKSLLLNRAAMMRGVELSGQTWKVEHGTPSAVWLGAPLVARGRILGVVAVQDYHDERAFGEDEKRLLTFIAEQAALAIERKRAEQALRDSEERHRIMHRISEAVHVSEDLGHLYQLIHQAVREVMPAHNFYIATCEPSGEWITFPYWADERDTCPVRRPAHLGVTGLILRSGSPMRFHPARGFVRRVEGDRVIHVYGTLEIEVTGAECYSESQVYLGVPLLSRGDTIGVMAVQDYVNESAYGPEEERFLTFVAEQTVLAIERKGAEQELRRALESEQELGRMKSSFTSLVSHEFRTPLGVIASSAEILRDYFERLQPEERSEHLETIIKHTRRMGGMMEEVLLLSRFDAGKTEFRPEPIALASYCQRIADEVLSATHHRCPIRVIGTDVLPSATADERLLRHVLTNLLMNASKYSDPGSAVDLKVFETGGDAVFEVRDRGIGIPESDRAWMFHAFQRGSNVGTRPGTGLGLVIVKRCVNLHGGRIELESAVGVGTTFRVYLPVFGGRTADRVNLLTPSTARSINPRRTPIKPV